MSQKAIEINRFLQAELERQQRDEVTAVDGARWLEKAGILKDSERLPGLPLRNFLRSGKIVGAKQAYNKRWAIFKTQYEPQLTIKELSKKLNLGEQAIYKKVQGAKIPYHTSGVKGIYFLESEIDRWLKNQGENKVVLLQEELTMIKHSFSQMVEKLQKMIAELEKQTRKNVRFSH
ncbi:helix-turn-helix domain-containing protein [candidate division KSB1 bacterium]|nr:helix-turn-helix domain-containing protein [candidate division KSB1 bacterium]